MAVKRGDMKTAQDFFQKCVDITPKMVAQLIEKLKLERVKYVVAPYEADSQLVYLEKKNYISAIISEDSDLLVFGAKVLLTKLSDMGECICVARNNFGKCQDLNLHDLNDAQFRAMAIFSGCDYSNGIPRIGLKTAHRFIRKYTTAERALRGIRLEGFGVPADFDKVFEQANLTFLHQRVYNLDEKRLVMLNESDKELSPETLEYIGRDMEPEIAEGIALGVLDPFTKKIISYSFTMPPFATTSMSLSTLPSQGNHKVTSFFKKAGHSSSTPASVTYESTKYSIMKESKPLSTVTLSNNSKNDTFSQSRSLVAKRASKIFDPCEKNIFGKQPVKSSEAAFVSKFFSAVKPKSKAKSNTKDLKNIGGLQTPSQSIVELPSGIDSDNENENENTTTTTTTYPNFDKENSMDGSISTPTSFKRKLNDLDRFTYQPKIISRSTVVTSVKRKKTYSPAVSASSLLLDLVDESDSCSSSGNSEIETPEKVRLQKAKAKRAISTATETDAGEEEEEEAAIDFDALQDFEEEVHKSPSRRATMRARDAQHSRKDSEAGINGAGSPVSGKAQLGPKHFRPSASGTSAANERITPKVCVGEINVRGMLDRFKYTGPSSLTR